MRQCCIKDEVGGPEVVSIYKDETRDGYCLDHPSVASTTLLTILFPVDA